MTTDLNVELSLPDSDGPDHFVPIWIMLHALCKVDQYLIGRALAEHDPYPPLYASGTRYRRDRPGREDWPDVEKILRRGGWADCKGLAAWRVGELRAAGTECEPVIKWMHLTRAQMRAQGWPAGLSPIGGCWLVHCLVRFPDGSTEDPSKILGMGGSYTDHV